MIALGYDLGRYLGWSVIDASTIAAPLYVASGTVDLEATGEDGALEEVYQHLVRFRPRAVGVERPARVFASQGPAAAVARANQLLPAAWLGGRIVEAARSSGARVEDIEAKAAREHLCGKRKVTDAIVRREVLARVKNWPPRGTDEHARDGAIVAVETAYRRGCLAA